MVQLWADSLVHQMVVMSVTVMVAKLEVSKVVHWVSMSGIVKDVNSVVLMVPYLDDYLVVR